MDGILTALRGHRVARPLQTDSSAAIEETADNDRDEVQSESVQNEFVQREIVQKEVVPMDALQRDAALEETLQRDVTPIEQPERFSAVVNNNKTSDDYLVNQIDEFREKALQLQNLLSTKESRIQELQLLVDEREGKAEELQQILVERQGKMNQMNDQMNQMNDQMSQMSQMSQMGQVEAQISQSQLDDISSSISTQMGDLFTKVSNRLDELADGIGEEWENSERINDMKFRQIGTSIDELKGSISPLADSISSLEPLKSTIEGSATQMNSLEENLSEKIHSENVKVFRNVQDLITELDEKIDQLSEMEDHIAGVKKLSTLAIVFAALDFAAILGTFAVTFLFPR